MASPQRVTSAPPGARAVPGGYASPRSPDDRTRPLSTLPDTPRGLGDIIVTARGMDEYLAMFGLEPAGLVGRRILDCPGGAGAFGAAARALGAEVTSVDPAYAIPPEVLIPRARADTLRGNRYAREHPDLYVWDWFASADQHARSRLAALEVFAADFTGPDARYRPAVLPALPFGDRTFDLVLSGHLLFTYPDHMDQAGHLAALRELVRVSRHEIRVFPLIDTTVTPSPYLDDLRRTLAGEGIDSALVPVAYEFQRGAHTMLVLIRRDAHEPPAQ